MSPKKQVQISSICFKAVILLIFAYGLMIFWFPLFLESKAETGAALSPMLKFMVNIHHLINKAEILVILTLLLGFIFALIWRIQSSMKYRNVNALTDSSN